MKCVIQVDPHTTLNIIHGFHVDTHVAFNLAFINCMWLNHAPSLFYRMHTSQFQYSLQHWLVPWFTIFRGLFHAHFYTLQSPWHYTHYTCNRLYGHNCLHNYSSHYFYHSQCLHASIFCRHIHSTDHHIRHQRLTVGGAKTNIGPRTFKSHTLIINKFEFF